MTVFFMGKPMSTKVGVCSLLWAPNQAPLLASQAAWDALSADPAFDAQLHLDAALEDA
jgi:hypothetical protein